MSPRFGMPIPSRGTCAGCKEELPKSLMTEHLAACLRPGQERLHVVVEGLHAPDYWLHLALTPKATLRHLDGFLRRIWLECCGHLSEFEIDGERYVSQSVGDYDARSMGVALAHVVPTGTPLIHTYDFGTPTPSRLRVLGMLECRPGRELVRLLARNLPPRIDCSCGASARQICSCCSDGVLCDRCAQQHGCGEDMLLPIVNSPRTGKCGYTG